MSIDKSKIKITTKEQDDIEDLQNRVRFLEKEYKHLLNAFINLGDICEQFLKRSNGNSDK